MDELQGVGQGQAATNGTAIHAKGAAPNGKYRGRHVRCADLLHRSF